MIRDTSAQDRVVKPAKKLPLTWLALAALGLGGAYFTFANFSTASSLAFDSIRIATVTRGVFERAVNATGRVVATHSPSLYSAAPGRVNFLKKPGDAVEQGEVLAHISSPNLESELEQEQNSLTSAGLDLERMRLDVKQRKLALKKARDLSHVNHLAAKRELKRATASFDMKVISEFDFEQAKDNLLTAQLNLDNAVRESEIKSDMIDFELKTNKIALARQQLVVDELQRRQEQLTLRSPVAGIIGNWLVQQDSKVGESDPLLTVVDLTAYEGELEIPQSFADDLAPGMAVNIKLAGKNFLGELRSVSPEVQDNHVKARVAFAEKEVGGLRQNQHLSARILLEKKDDVLQLPRGAYLEAGDIAFLIEDDVASKQTIRIGSRSIDKVEVLSGLQEGDQIISSSVAKIKQYESVYINR